MVLYCLFVCVVRVFVAPCLGVACCINCYAGWFWFTCWFCLFVLMLVWVGWMCLDGGFDDYCLR